MQEIPYNPSHPASERMFVGRHLLKRQMISELLNERCFELIGSAGIGKTSLLLAVQRGLIINSSFPGRAGMPLPIYVSCKREETNLAKIILSIIEETERTLRIYRNIVCPPEVVSSAKAKAEARQLNAGMRLLLEQAFSSDEFIHQPILLLDDVHRIHPLKIAYELASVLETEVNQQQLVLALASKKPIAEQLRNDVSPLRALITYQHTLNTLTREDTNALVNKALDYGWKVEEGCANFLYEATTGHPYRLHYYLYATLAAERRVSLKGLRELYEPKTEQHLDAMLERRSKDHHTEAYQLHPITLNNQHQLEWRMPVAQTFSQGYAVIIGVGADLPVTVNDARAISDMLLDPGRCAYPADQVRLLVSEQARRESIVSSLEWLADSTGPSDTAVVYFSGHGIETPDFHLVPYGFNGRYLGATAVSGAEFTSLLRSIKAGKLLVLLDCCHAGGQAEAKGFIKSPMPSNAIEELGRAGGRVVIASSRRDELSWTGHPYSQFTAATLEALAGYGAFERDGFGRVLDLAMYVGRYVPERTHDRQHPIIKVSNLQDNFAIAYYAAGSSEPKILPWSATPSAPAVPTTAEANDGGNEQTRTWRRMLKNYQESLLLIEERMSEYVEFASVPLQLVRSRQVTEAKIREMEDKLRGEHNA